MKSYEQMHAGLFWARGKASEHPCAGPDCDRPALHWAYLHSATTELRSPTGSPYSEDFEDYAPMCRGCHRKFDLAHDPAQVSAFRAVGQKSPADKEQHRLVSSKGGLVGGQVTAKMQRRCAQCPMESWPAGIANHQRSSGHVGWVTL